MKDFIEISTSLYTNSLTLFVGTGFSKYITNGAAPSWLELMVEATKAIDKKDRLLKQLFHFNADGEVEGSVYELTICAQILEVEYSFRKINIKSKIAEIINSKINPSTIDFHKVKLLQDFFTKHPNINIITTNYDTLFSDHIMPLTSRVIIEGSTIPRINTGQNIYHIHGSASKPESIILTLNDYYGFQNRNNYFSRKFFTLLQETTVVILGYSLGDFNLNTILSEGKSSRNESFRSTDIYYVSKREVNEVIKTFYEYTYGIKVIEKNEINTFFDNIEKNYPEAVDLIDSVEDLLNVMKNEGIEYTDEFLLLRMSLSQILIQAGSLGIASNDDRFLETLIKILDRKKGFTQVSGAWDQYVHLADWLIQVASVVIIKGTVIENEFCELAKYSFAHSSKKLYFGQSWHAWWEWYNRWLDMRIENQEMLKAIIDSGTWNQIYEIEKLPETMGK